MTATAVPDTVFAPELNISNLVMRPWRDPSDYPAMQRVLCLDKQSQGLEEAMSPADLQARLESLPKMDVRSGVFLLEHAGEVIGYQTTRTIRELNGTHVYIHHGFLDPVWKGRGIGQAMIRHSEQVLRDVAASHPAQAPKFFQSSALETQTHLIGLLEQAHYLPQRYFSEMLRPTLDDIPAYELPPGIETRPALPHEYRRVWDTAVEAFKEHWGEEEHDQDDYVRWLEGPHFHPELWHIAWDGDRPVAIAWNFIDRNDNGNTKHERGFTDDLATLPAYRGRGIAQALLAQSLRQFKVLGLTEAALDVDSENKSGALRLYTKLGYRPNKTMIVYRKALDLVP